MKQAYKPSATSATDGIFERADAAYAAVKSMLLDAETLAESHAEVERRLHRAGMSLLRELLQSHVTLRGLFEPTSPVVGEDGHERAHRRSETSRSLSTVFGEVEVVRPAFGARGRDVRHPTDASLNLPASSYSLELQRRVAAEAARVSFDQVVRSIDETTGGHVPKRQAEEIARDASQDFDDYYASSGRESDPAATSGIVVLSFDQKGVCLVDSELNHATRKVGEAARRKLATRLSKGEKRGRKRMAIVSAVYTIAPHVRTPEAVVDGLRRVADASPTRRPRPEEKKVTASLERSLEQVVADAFDEADRRDPHQSKKWYVLIDGNEDLLRKVTAESTRRKRPVTTLIDFIHALEYLWRASTAFYAEPDAERESWVLERLTWLLQGKASIVAAALRRTATNRGLSKAERAPVDTCAKYLLKRAHLMKYGDALAAGAPIATGVVEGTCRHLICDRLEITGARWTIATAEAVLKLRALASNDDFDDYWSFHETAEHRRNHLARYANATLPGLALPRRGRHLQVVK